MDLLSFYQEIIHKPFCQYTLIDSFAILLVFILVVMLLGIISRWPS